MPIFLDTVTNRRSERTRRARRRRLLALAVVIIAVTAITAAIVAATRPPKTQAPYELPGAAAHEPARAAPPPRPAGRAAVQDVRPQLPSISRADPTSLIAGAVISLTASITIVLLLRTRRHRPHHREPAATDSTAMLQRPSCATPPPTHLAAPPPDAAAPDHVDPAQAPRAPSTTSINAPTPDYKRGLSPRPSDVSFAESPRPIAYAGRCSTVGAHASSA